MSGPYPAPYRSALIILAVMGPLLLPRGLHAQEYQELVLSRSLDNPRRHADHAHLHRLQPYAAGIEIIALETIERLAEDADALCQAARLALVAGLVSTDERESQTWFERGEAYARSARQLRPRDPGAMFAVAAAIGLQARHQSLRERIRTAGRVLDLTDSILAIDPGHPGGLHLRGQLTGTAMRLNPVVRHLVDRILGGDLVGRASWAKAEADLRRALDAEPANPAHRVELALVLQRTDRESEAREQLRRVAAGPGGEAVAEYYRERALELLAEMR